MKNKLKNYLHAALVLPMFLTNVALIDPSVTKPIRYIFHPEQKIEDVSQIRAAKIDDYFNRHQLPLAGYGLKMVTEATKNDLDWRLLAAVAMRESTGGKFACKFVKNNPFGWASCKYGFDTMDQAIETVGLNLGGNNPKTARYYGGELEERLLNYNGRAVDNYPEDVFAIMQNISDEEGM